MTKICICGAGTMGMGIAQVSAAAGFETILFDVNANVLKGAREKLIADLQMLVDKGRLTAFNKDNILNKLLFEPVLNNCIADVIIEAIIEKPEIKIDLFNQLALINSSQTIFASNTSSLSIDSLAAQIVNPERVAGLHFFNPAPLMKLVEVVKGDKTSAAVIDKLITLAKALGKTPVLCKDAPGFIVNRVARPYYIEALRIAEEGHVDFAIIDNVLQGIGFKLGPFKLMDLIGNDINYTVSTSVYEQLSKPERLKPSYLQKQKVDKGELGKKTGRGYYAY